jgi:hypothetical protein
MSKDEGPSRGLVERIATIVETVIEILRQLGLL